MFFLKIIDDQDQELELPRDGYTSPIPPDLQWRGWEARAGIGEPCIPKLRKGFLLPNGVSIVLEARRTPEPALAAVIGEDHVQGTMTRGVDDPFPPTRTKG